MLRKHLPMQAPHVRHSLYNDGQEWMVKNRWTPRPVRNVEAS